MKYLKAPGLSMNFSENKKGMKMRFSNILNAEKKYVGKGALTVCALSVFAVGAFVGCSKNDATINNNLNDTVIEEGMKLSSSAKDLETAMRLAILNSNATRYLEGECTAEGHILLGNETRVNAKDNTEEEYCAYALVSYGEYGFENGIFTKVSGSGAIPTKITFKINAQGEYSLAEYEQAQDGSLYEPSIREMFPENIAERALHYTDEDSAKLQAQEEVYAKEYLAGVRDDAKIQQHVPKTLTNMNVKASNALIDLFNEYPYWIGTEEKIENDVRYVYEKQWEDKGNGDGTVTFKKYEYDTKKVTEETVIEIKNGELNYIKGEVRTARR